MFRVKLNDMLTGYRIMSRRFVKSFPFTAEGFGIETELTVHAVRLLMPMAEIETRYKERPEGSVSKLNTYRDGLRILFTIAALVREERPLVFFTTIAAFLIISSLLLGTPVVLDYFRTGLVPRLPTAVLAVGFDGARLPVAGERTDPRHRHARPLGGQAHGLSRHSRTRRT